ncbi:PAS domain-containing protein [Autumnicola musiva]|uniref:PAS domain-containing protein n=1 Tax=Autumnicola musiva TaxID=3075589 RepID=A0ABU3D904_9FLAO|nr:PAS domain-containing protein [Zunongwangia sp. F117]MDT0678012.1 PAS domain-containing protein [Zunongwangia sp. F117]
MSKQQENLSNMRCLDLYLETLDSREHQKVAKKIEPLETTPAPLTSMDISSASFHYELTEAKRGKELDILRRFNRKYNWHFDFNSIMEQNYDAIVLTDNEQVINWVSKGFYHMTGYTSQDAIGRSPQFLQGAKTDDATVNRIKQKLGKTKAFTETILNYRKNNEEYLCEITVIPLLNGNKKLTHYLALEKEILP